MIRRRKLGSGVGLGFSTYSGDKEPGEPAQIRVTTDWKEDLLVSLIDT